MNTSNLEYLDHATRDLVLPALSQATIEVLEKYHNSAGGLDGWQSVYCGENQNASGIANALLNLLTDQGTPFCETLPGYEGYVMGHYGPNWIVWGLGDPLSSAITELAVRGSLYHDYFEGT